MQSHFIGVRTRRSARYNAGHSSNNPQGLSQSLVVQQRGLISAVDYDKNPETKIAGPKKDTDKKRIEPEKGPIKSIPQPPTKKAKTPLEIIAQPTMPMSAEIDKKPNYRSNLYSVIHHINSLTFNKSQKDALEKFCPFWKMIYSIFKEILTTTSTRKNDQIIMDIIRCYDSETHGLYIGGSSKMLTMSDIANIFGITGGKNMVETGKVSYARSSFYQKFFHDKKNPNLIASDIVRCLRTALKGKKKTDLEDVVRLTTLLFLPSVFLPTKGGSIPWSYIECVLDVSAIKKYDWAGHIADILNCNIVDNYRQPQNVTGCVLALPYWLMENFKFTERIASDDDMWCVKWSLSDLNALANKNSDLLALCSFHWSLSDSDTEINEVAKEVTNEEAAHEEVDEERKRKGEKAETGTKKEEKGGKRSNWNQKEGKAYQLA